MAPFPILPTIAILVGLFLLEYIIYDSYKQNKSKAPEGDLIKNLSIHDQSRFFAANATPSTVELPSMSHQKVPLGHRNAHSLVGQNIIENSPRESLENNVIKPILNSPPVPQSGLPEGWTIEQWNYYGAQWLESRNKS